MRTTDQLRLAHMQGEIELLKVMVSHLLETRNSSNEFGPHLPGKILAACRHFGETSSECIAFEQAYNTFGPVYL